MLPLLLFFLIGCNAPLETLQNAAPSSEAPLTLDPNSLVGGTWKSQISGVLMEVDFSETLSRATTTVQDPNSNEVTSIRTDVSSYTIGALVPGSLGVRELNFLPLSKKLKLLSQDIVTDYNARSVCGKTNWQLNEEVELVGMMCDLYPYPAGSTLYTSFRLENAALQFSTYPNTQLPSATHPHTTPENRITDFANSIVYQR